MNTPQRRKHVDPSIAEGEVALLLYNTYAVERQRHLNQQRLDTDPVAPHSFKHDFGEFREARRQRAEDAESNPPGTSSQGSMEIMWRNLAQKLLAQRIDPAAFIRRQFAVLHAGSPVPPPAAMTGTVAFQRYRDGMEMNYQEVEIAFRIQRNKFETEVVNARCMGYCKSDELAWACVLDDVESELSALFRFCMAQQLITRKEVKNVAMFKAISDRFREAAALQYIVSAEDYQTIWRSPSGASWIPKGFNDEAKLIYAHIYGA